MPWEGHSHGSERESVLETCQRLLWLSAPPGPGHSCKAVTLLGVVGCDSSEQSLGAPWGITHKSPDTL